MYFHQVIGKASVFVIMKSFRYYMHILQIKPSILSTLFWCGLSTKTIVLHHGPAHYDIHSFANKCHIFSRIIFYSYGLYNIFLQKIGFEFPISIEKSYPMIVCCAPYLQNPLLKSLIMLIILSFVGWSNLYPTIRSFISFYEWRLL